MQQFETDHKVYHYLKSVKKLIPLLLWLHFNCSCLFAVTDGNSCH